MNTLPAHVDVLVVGLGPVGAAMACLLGRYGVRTLAIDREAGIVMMPRAIALDNEALRILQMAGLGEDAFERLAIPRVRYVSPFFGEFAQINTAGSLDGHPKLVTFYQPQLEHALREQVGCCAEVEIANCVEMLGFEESGDAVRVRLRTADGVTTELVCRYLVAADGASSATRTALGLGFGGQSYAEEWLIVDAERPDQTLEHIEFNCDPRRPTPHMPAPGRRERWEFMLHPGEPRELMERDDTIRELLRPYGKVEEMHLARKAVYRFHARTCERFGRGRVFLAGDAAHITPPFVGQGLVAGLRDVANLAWKLAWVLRGAAAPRILESYDTERRPHARAMIDLACFMGHLIMPRNALKAWLVHGTIRMLRFLPPVRTWFDDLRIKPSNCFAEGLFAGNDKRNPRGLRGRWLPQGWLRAADGAIALSDEAFGDHMVLLGIGADPREHLDQQTLQAWCAAGGTVMHVEPRGGRVCGTGAWEDLSDSLAPGTAAVGRVVLVRPDRTIFDDGPVRESARLVRETLALLGTPRADPAATTSSAGVPVDA